MNGFSPTAYVYLYISIYVQVTTDSHCRARNHLAFLVWCGCQGKTEIKQKKKNLKWIC